MVGIWYRHVGAELAAPFCLLRLGLGLLGVGAGWIWLNCGIGFIIGSRVDLELVPPANVDLNRAAAGREVEPVVSQGDDAPDGADGHHGVRLADGAEQSVGVQVVLALTPGWEGPPLSAYGLLVGHYAGYADVEGRAAEGRALADSHAGGEGFQLEVDQVRRELVYVDRPLEGHRLFVFY